MPFVIALAGNIGSGKTTLARKLAERFQAEHLASDDIRAELWQSQSASSGRHVFGRMRARTFAAISDRRNVVLDSTGQSHRYTDFLDQLRSLNYLLVIVELYCDEEAWSRREAVREDRGGEGQTGRLSADVYRRSTLPLVPEDIFIDTTRLTPDDVFAEVVERIQEHTTK